MPIPVFILGYFRTQSKHREDENHWRKCHVAVKGQVKMHIQIHNLVIVSRVKYLRTLLSKVTLNFLQALIIYLILLA